MAKKPRRRSRRRELPLAASLAIIAMLAALALVLSYLAFQNLNNPTDQDFAAPDSTVSESPVILDTIPSTEPEPEPAAPASEPVALVAPSRLLALDGSLGIRARVGECSAPGGIEFSTDGGQNWLASAAFEATSATQVLRILPNNGGTTFVVALNEACTPQIYSTADNGLNWNGPLSAVGTWYLDPASPSALGAPGGAKTITCEARALSAVTDREAGVLCTDGSIISTANGGATWSDPVPVEGITALAYSEQNLLAMATGDGQNCAGIQLLNLGTEGGVEKLSCVDMDAGLVMAGDIAMAESGNTLMLWAGENQFTSTNGGQTWR